MTLLESLSLWVVCYLGELPLGRLEVGVVLDVGLDLGVRRQSHVLRSVSNHRGLGLGHVGTAVGQLVEALVVLHVEDHVAHLAPEAVLVPDLLKAFKLLHRVNRLPALGAKLRHLDNLISLYPEVTTRSADLTRAPCRSRVTIIANCQLLGSAVVTRQPRDLTTFCSPTQGSVSEKENHENFVKTFTCCINLRDNYLSVLTAI